MGCIFGDLVVKQAPYLKYFLTTFRGSGSVVSGSSLMTGQSSEEGWLSGRNLCSDALLPSAACGSGWEAGSVETYVALLGR